MIEQLAKMIRGCDNHQREEFLNHCSRVIDFFASAHPWKNCISQLVGKEAEAMKQIIAIDQLPKNLAAISSEMPEALIKQLVEVDDFYREMGGIIGYQAEVMRLLEKKSSAIDPNIVYHSPPFIDISNETPETLAAIEAGIEALPFLCEIYPLGGAADRLHLICEKTGNELPAAKLEFAERTLLQRLLDDLEAREMLYFHKTGKRIHVPIVMMTSVEKENHKHVLDILEENGWFGRPKDRFMIFSQPLVPVVNESGEWVWQEDSQLMMKPGGHGAIWKKAYDVGVFDWLRRLEVRYALIRQVNNLLAGLDYGLLAFTGIGVLRKMSFGFASCSRPVGAAEGVNVLCERKTKKGFAYTLTNVEYCDFKKFGLVDEPLNSLEPYSQLPSNTNILFANIDDLEKAIKICPYPGLIMNVKKTSDQIIAIGRLELTMQNIADAFVDERDTPLTSHKSVFITYNARHKTISTAKKAYDGASSFIETPENCFYDLMRSHRELLEKYCGYRLPVEKSLEEILVSNPAFVFLFHPLLGPRFRTIGEKLSSGILQEGSELRIEVANTRIEHLELNGSLLILANNPSLAKCLLCNVKILNSGVNWQRSKPFWKGRYERFESLTIILEGNAEFIAENIVIQGSKRIVVKEGERLIF